MNKKIKKIFAGCLVASMVLTNMLFTTAFASTKHAGANRYETAAKIAKAGWTSADVAVLATGEDFPDALAAAPLADANNAPILLTGAAALDSYAKDAITTLGVDKVIVVGGEKAVSAAVVTALEAAGVTVERIAGTDRYNTSVKVAEKLGTSSTVVLANGYSFADALSVSSIAAAKGMPILLTAKDAVSADVKAFIGTKDVVVVGGSNAVAPTAVSGLTVKTTLAGADRYATNKAILEYFAADIDFANVFLATGLDYPDALAGSVYAAKLGAPVVLVGSTLDAGVKSFLAGKASADTVVVALGGAATVASAASSLEAVIAPAGPLKVESVSAVDSLTVAVKFNKAVDLATAEDDTNYTIAEAINTSNDLTVTEAELQEDEKTVYLTLDDATALTNTTTNYTVSVTDVLDVDGNEMDDDYTAIVALSDKTRPTVKEFEVTDNNTITVTFSEPVDITSGSAVVVVDSNDDEVTTLTIGDASDEVNEVTISGIAALDDEETYTVRINSDVVDYAGNLLTPNPYEKTFKVTEDTTEPKVSSVTVLSKGAFKVVFNESIDAVAEFDVEIDDVTDATAVITAVSGTNNKEFTVELTAPLTSGLHKVELVNFEDVAGNVQDTAFVKYYKFADTAAKLTSTTATIKTIGGAKYAVFTFDRDIDTLNAADIIADRTDEDNVTYDEEIDVLLFDIAAGLTQLEDNQLAIAIGTLPEGTYEFTLDAGFVEAYGADSAEADVKFVVSTSTSEVTVDDLTTLPGGSDAINGDDVNETINQVIVTFSDDVDTTALNVANYTVDGSRVFETAKFYGDNATVRLTLKDGAVKYNGNYEFEIKNIKDENGNTVDTFSEVVYFEENTDAVISKAEVKSLTTIEVTFSEIVTGTSDDEDFVVTVAGKEVDITSAAIVVDGSGDNTKVYLITLADEIDDVDSVVVVKTSADFDLVDANGNPGKTDYSKTAVWDID